MDLPSASALLSGNQPSSTTHCTFCKQPHPTASCHVVTNRAARRECLKKQGRCFICLRKSHLAKDCPSKIICFKCSGRHHVSLCERNRKNDSRPQTKQTEMPPILNEMRSLTIQNTISFCRQVQVNQVPFTLGHTIRSCCKPLKR